MNYGLNTTYTIPDLVGWSNTQQSRIDNRAKERNDAYRNLMQMLGRGYGAYKMGQDYRDWKADQAMWNDELGQLEDIGTGYYDPNDLDMSMLENSIAENAWNKAVPNATTDWRDQYANSHRYGVDDLDSLATLGLV